MLTPMKLQAQSSTQYLQHYQTLVRYVKERLKNELSQPFS